MLAAEAASQGAKAPGTSMSPKRINALEERKSSVLLEVRVKFIKAVSQDESCDMQGKKNEKKPFYNNWRNYAAPDAA